MSGQGRPGCRVFIGRIQYHTREKDLERHFRPFGRLRDIIIKPGYGFVEFEEERDADDAVYELNNRQFMGERVNVEHAKGTPRKPNSYPPRSDGGGYNNRDNYRGGDQRRPPYERYGPPTRTQYKVLVSNLSSKCSWQDLKDYMRKAGEITYADAHRENRNEGVVEFKNYEDMKRCIQLMDGAEICGRIVSLSSLFKGRSPVSRSMSRSRSPVRKRPPPQDSPSPPPQRRRVQRTPSYSPPALKYRRHRGSPGSP